MGVSFKVSKKGSRFRPKPVAQQKDVAFDDESEVPKDGSLIGARNPSSKNRAEVKIRACLRLNCERSV